MFNPFEESADSDVTDTSLVERAKGGDKAALDELIRRHQAWIYNIALRMVWEPRDAEDVTQEVLIKVITRLSHFEGKSKFRTWLYRIVINHVINMKARRHELTAECGGGASAPRAPAPRAHTATIRISPVSVFVTGHRPAISSSRAR